MSWPVVRLVRHAWGMGRVGINPNAVNLKQGTPPPHPWFISVGPISFIN